MDKEKELTIKENSRNTRMDTGSCHTAYQYSYSQFLSRAKYIRARQKRHASPGLNCYSCPAATGACPIGAFQAVVGSSRFKFSYYITGFLILLGVTLGRFICGFLCPFGWFQDLLHKIPGKKFSTARLKPLRYLKYIILDSFRYPSADACNKLDRNGRSLLL